MNPLKIKQLEGRLKEIEDEVAETEAEISGLEAQLANYVNAELTIQQNTQLTERRTQLDKLMNEWEQTTQALEEAR